MLLPTCRLRGSRVVYVAVHARVGRLIQMSGYRVCANFRARPIESAETASEILYQYKIRLHLCNLLPILTTVGISFALVTDWI